MEVETQRKKRGEEERRGEGGIYVVMRRWLAVETCSMCCHDFLPHIFLFYFISARETHPSTREETCEAGSSVSGETDRFYPHTPLRLVPSNSFLPCPASVSYTSTGGTKEENGNPFKLSPLIFFCFQFPPLLSCEVSLFSLQKKVFILLHCDLLFQACSCLIALSFVFLLLSLRSLQPDGAKTSEK